MCARRQGIAGTGPARCATIEVKRREPNPRIIAARNRSQEVPPMRVTHTHHVALYTANFARIRDFYTDVLGFPLNSAFPGRNIVFVDAGSTAIEIVENTTTDEGVGGWAHLALEVPDVDAAYAELSARGVTFHVPPKDFPEEAPSVRIAFFRDPDGNELELVQPLGARYP